MKKQALRLALGTLCLFFALNHRVQAQSEDTPRYEVGVQFSSLSVEQTSSGSQAGFGGRFTYNFTDYLAAEAQVDFYPNGPKYWSNVTGERTTTGAFGVKAGKRYDRFGVYAKARPGFVHFGRAFSGYTLSGDPANPQSQFITPTFHDRTEFATDLGGVLEFYPSRRIATRFDIGDTIIRYKARTVSYPVYIDGTPSSLTLYSFRQPAHTTHNFTFSAGISFRFGN